MVWQEVEGKTTSSAGGKRQKKTTRERSTQVDQRMDRQKHRQCVALLSA